MTPGSLSLLQGVHAAPYSTWSWYQADAAAIGSEPNAVSPEAGRLDVVARGQDGQVYKKTFVNYQWSAWQSLGGVAVSGPQGLWWNDGATRRYDVFVLGSNGEVHSRTWLDSAGDWLGWAQIGSPTGAEIEGDDDALFPPQTYGLYSTAAADTSVRTGVFDMSGSEDEGSSLTIGGVLEEQSSPGARTLSTASAGCVSNGWRRRTKKSLLGSVQWRMRMNVNFCFSGTEVTSTNVWISWEDLSSTSDLRGVIQRTDRWQTLFGNTHGARMFYRQGRVDNCLLKYGCIASSYPWIRATLKGDGTWTRSSGG